MNYEKIFTPPPRKNLCFLIAITLFLIACPISVFADDPSAAGDDSTPITAGVLYDAVQGTDPRIELSESSSGVTFLLDATESDLTTKENVRRYFWDAVQLLDNESVRSDLSSRSSILFMYLDGDNIQYFSVSDLVDIYNFSTSFINLKIGDADLADTFRNFYYAVFGGHDVQNKLNVKLYDFSQSYGTEKREFPSTYRNGYLWVFCCFNQFCGYSVDDSSIAVQVLVNDAEIDGEGAAEDFKSYCNIYDALVAADSAAMPYTEINVDYLFIDDRSKLCNVKIKKEAGGWKCYVERGDNSFSSAYNF